LKQVCVAFFRQIICMACE